MHSKDDRFRVWSDRQVLSESLMWIATAVEDFGLGVVNVQQLIETTVV